MPRYIDAETIPDLFDEKFKETQKLIEAGETQLDNLAEGFAEAEKIVLFKATTADVQEVKHGKWIYKGHHEMMGHAFECSACERWMFANSIKNVVGEYPYCHCGAKMDLEERNDL